MATKTERPTKNGKPAGPKPQVVPRRRAFDDLTDEPCPVCRELADREEIQAEAVMPLPKFPALLRTDGRKCCRDCQATETAMHAYGIHPSFGPARLTVANERLESLRMPRGMAELFGMCSMRLIDPASIEDLASHQAWLERHNIFVIEAIH